MKGLLLIALIAISSPMHAAEEPRIIATVKRLPVALSDDFEFRKTATYFLTEHGKRVAERVSRSGKVSTAAATTALNFERQYHLQGAVTRIDQRQRAGHYLTFFWRSNRAADVTLRLEYRQEKLRSFVQAQEISYPNAHGNLRTEFKIIGDDYLDDGRLLSWRCLIIEKGKVVAENRSFLWE